MKANIHHVFILGLLLMTAVNTLTINKIGQQSIEDIIDLQLNMQTSLDKPYKKVVQQKSIKDIQVKQETLENMNMEDVLKIANKGSTNSSDSMDRVVMFLQQEQKMVEKENQKKRDSAINDIIKQDSVETQQKKEIQKILLDQNKPSSFRPDKNEQLILTDENLQNDKLSQSPNLVMKPVVQVRKTKVDESDLQNIKQELINNISQQKQLKQQQIENVNKPQQLPKSLTQILQNKTAAPVVDTFELKRKMIDEKKKLEEKMKIMMAQKEKKMIPVESSNDEDNLSLAEIIAKKYKKHIHQSNFTTPEDAAKVMIKDTLTFNVNSPEETDGSKEEQELYQSELGNIETNLAEKWSDLGQVKQTLWKKLNGDKEMKKEKEKREVRLAQLTQKIHQQVLDQKAKKAQSQTKLASVSQNSINETKFEAFTLDSIKLFEEENPTLVIVIIILIILLFICCCCYCIPACFIATAIANAREKEQEAKEAKRDEQIRKNEEKERKEKEANKENET